MNIGIMGGYGVPDKKFFQGFRIVGIVVNQGFDQQTVFDVDAFVPADRNFKLLVMKDIPLMFELVAPDIAFV